MVVQALCAYIDGFAVVLRPINGIGREIHKFERVKLAVLESQIAPENPSSWTYLPRARFLARSPRTIVVFLAFDATAYAASLSRCAGEDGIARRNALNSMKAAMQRGVSRPLMSTLLKLARSLRRSLRSSSSLHTRTLDTASQHLLADIGFDCPRYELPTWERYIHR